MRSYAILTDSAQLVYVWCDEEFAEHLKHVNMVDHEVFDLLGSCQYFYSLIAVCYLALKETEEFYSSIEGEEDKFTVCFKKYDQFLYVGFVNKTNCKDHIFRAIGFLRSSIAFLFGYCGQYQLKSSYSTVKYQMWYCLNTLLVTYLNLYQNDNSFFMEGIEELQVSKDVKNTCENLTKRCKQFIDNKVRKQLQCIFLYAGTKLLHYQYFSNCNNVTTHTVLMILAMLQSDFCPSSLKNAPCIFDDQTKSQQNHFQNPDHDTLYLKTDFDYLFENASTAPTLSTQSNVDDSINQVTRRISDASFSPTSAQPDLSAFFNDEDHSDSQLSYAIPSFLFNEKKRCIPCTVCSIPVLPSIKMAIVYKNPKAHICDEIRLTLLSLKRLRLIIEQNSMPHILEASNDLRAYLDKRVMFLFRKSMQAGSAVKELTEKIKTVWLDGKEHLKSIEQLNDSENSAVLRCLSLMDNLVFDLFKLLYPSCVDLEDKCGPTIYFTQIKMLAKHELKCYQEYLLVRNQQNITINSYLKEFPGIVHFAFVKRSAKNHSFARDILFSPSLTSASCSSTIGKVFFDSLQKELWNFRNLASACHINKEPLFCQKLNGFTFASAITFGPSRVTQSKSDIDECWKEKFSSIVCDSPSMFCGNFYERVILKSMHNLEIVSVEEYYLFELITVHFDGVPTAVIMKQRQELLKRLLEFN